MQADKAKGPAASVPAATSSAPANATPANVQTAPPRPLGPTVAEALQSGVLIVVSKASQRMHVFRDGQPWLSAAVSTGRRGHATPAGVFPVLEKRRFHRSNIYSNAPMPFMQRLTYSGIAIHAGRLPGYPASHGCIRVSPEVARALFGRTRVGRTTVVVTNAALRSDAQALAVALAAPSPGSPRISPAPVLAYARVQSAAGGQATADAGPPGAAPPHAGQTIQLAAAGSAKEAEAHWARLVQRHPGLVRFDKAVIPVTVGSQRFFRLRASGPGAFSFCAQQKGAGLDCFRVL